VLVPAGGREAQDLPPRVAIRALALHEPGVVEARQQPAQLAGVHVEPAPQVGDLGRLRPPELEQHARVREGVRRAVQP
jgi:hypothetical protein